MLFLQLTEIIYDADTILLNTQGKNVEVLPTQILQILTLI